MSKEELDQGIEMIKERLQTIEDELQRYESLDMPEPEHLSDLREIESSLYQVAYFMTHSAY